MRNVVQLCLAASNILLIREMREMKPRFSPSYDRSCMKMACLFANNLKRLGHRMIKQLLNSVIAKCRNLSVSRRLIIYLSQIDLLATDKSRHSAQLAQ